MRKELREHIIKVNQNWNNTEKYLESLNMHLCERAIFTNGHDSKYIGTIGKDFNIESIKWN